MPNPEQTAAHPSGTEQAVGLTALMQRIFDRYSEAGWLDADDIVFFKDLLARAARPLDTRQPDQVALLVAGLERIADESWIHDERNRGGVAMYAAMILAAFHGGGNVG